MVKPTKRSARVVQAKVEDGIVVDFEGQDKVKKYIWYRIHNKRSYSVKQAPIYQG